MGFPQAVVRAIHFLLKDLVIENRKIVSSYSLLSVCGRPEEEEEEDSRMSLLFCKGAIQNLRENIFQKCMSASVRMCARHCA